jgi:hypothetical protein
VIEDDDHADLETMDEVAAEGVFSKAKHMISPRPQ